VLRLDGRNCVLAVLDGHGSAYGGIAARAAAEAMRAYMGAHFGSLRLDPRGVMEACFEHGHRAIHEALRVQPGVVLREGLLLESDGVGGLQPCDGGATASVAALIDGSRLVYAAVGDSAGILAHPSAAGVAVEELIAEHSSMRLDEWERRLATGGCAVVYDTPEMFDEARQLPVWERDGRGGWRKSARSERLLEESGAGYKTERGDRAAVTSRVTPALCHSRWTQTQPGALL